MIQKFGKFKRAWGISVGRGIRISKNSIIIKDIKQEFKKIKKNAKYSKLIINIVQKWSKTPKNHLNLKKAKNWDNI